MQHNKPYFTIVTPVYNREKLIKKAISSVTEQSFTDWEYIVVDDGSNDNTWNLLRNYCSCNSRIIALKRDRAPKGAQTCRNIGMKTAKGSYLIFLDSDDMLEPFCLEQRYKFIEENKSFDLAVFPKKNLEKNSKDDFLKLFLSYKLPLQTTDSLWLKKYLIKIGGFNEKLIRYQDVELSIRALSDPDCQFIMSCKHQPDSRYTYQSNISEGSSSDIIFTALKLFIHEANNLLLDRQISFIEIRKLKAYLRSWLIYEHKYSQLKNSMQLIHFFYKKTIISIWLLFFCVIGIGLFSLIPLRYLYLFYYHFIFRFL